MNDINSMRRRLAGGLLGAVTLTACRTPAPVPRPDESANVGALNRTQRAFSGFRLVFGSCADQNRPQPIWAAVAAEQADLLLLGGDNVYASKAPWSLAALQAAYAQQAAVPGFSALLDKPFVSIWDDHDYGSNDGGAEFADKAQAKEEFLKFFKAAPDDPRRQREGLYDARVSGPPGQRVQIILLDTRWFRSPWRRTSLWNAKGRERYEADDDTSKTLLGEVQWAWLAQQLAMPAEVRLIYSSIQVLAMGHGYERWGLMPHQRERLLKLVASAPSRATVLLSGDRHIGALYEEGAGLPRRIIELTSSGLSHAWTTAQEDDTKRLGELVRVNHYGVVDVDWSVGAAHLRLHGETGQALLQHKLPMGAG